MPDGSNHINILKSFFVTRRWALLAVLALAIAGCAEKTKTPEEILSEAQAIGATQKLGEAISLLEIYDRENPGNFAIVEQLAFFYGEVDDPATSAMFFARAAEIDPSQAEHLLFAAQAWQNAGDLDSTINLYQQYILARPNDQSARIALSDLYYLYGDLDEARNTLLRSNRLSPKSGVQVRLGELFLESGNLALAQQWFDSAARFGDENRDEALLGLLEVVIRGNRFADADQLVTVIDEEFPGRLEASHIAAVRPQLEKWRKQQAAAVAAAEELQGIRTPTDGRLPKPTPTEQVSPPSVDAADVAKPEPATIDDATASTEGTEIVAAPAETTLEEGSSSESDLSPPDKEERVARVEANMEPFVRPEPAVPSDGPLNLFPTDEFDTGSNNVIASVPTGNDYASFLAQARVAFTNERYAESIKLYHRSLARSSSDPVVWSELSEAQRRSGENQTALASASEAMRRAPDAPGLRLQYLRVAESNLRPNALLEAMEKARRDFPLQPEFTLLIARAHRELGNTRFAQRYYQDFIRLAPPSHPEFAKAETELSEL
tara:strand:- start:137480 stop:139126 length:1647 start_codon:yes stop_codon:yes gene_type:complete